MRAPVLILLGAMTLAGTAAAQTGMTRPATIPPTGSPVPLPSTKRDAAQPGANVQAAKPGGARVESTMNATSRGGTDKRPDGTPALSHPNSQPRPAIHPSA